MYCRLSYDTIVSSDRGLVEQDMLWFFFSSYLLLLLSLSFLRSPPTEKLHPSKPYFVKWSKIQNVMKQAKDIRYMCCVDGNRTLDTMTLHKQQLCDNQV